MRKIHFDKVIPRVNSFICKQGVAFALLEDITEALISDGENFVDTSEKFGLDAECFARRVAELFEEYGISEEIECEIDYQAGLHVFGDDHLAKVNLINEVSSKFMSQFESLQVPHLADGRSLGAALVYLLAAISSDKSESFEIHSARESDYQFRDILRTMFDRDHDVWKFVTLAV